MWKEGKLDVPLGNGKFTNLHYWAMVNEKPDKYGIMGGRVVKLLLMQDGKVVFNYDRGIDTDFQTELAKNFIAVLLKEFE